MSCLTNSLLPLNRIALSQGDGLRKEFLTLLEKNMYRGEDLASLGAKFKSVGPRYQDLTDDEIANSNCVKLNESPVINP